MLALVAARAHFPHVPRKNIFVVSLGTGSSSFIPIEKLGGDLSWAEHIVDVLTDGVAASTAYQIKNLLKEGVNYFRIDTHLNATFGLDDVSNEAIQKLEETAQDLYEKNKKQLEEVYTVLKLPKTPWDRLGFELGN